MNAENGIRQSRYSTAYSTVENAPTRPNIATCRPSRPDPASADARPSRSATSDTELGGRKIAKGDWLMLCYASGNRDEEVFEEPYQFRSSRKPNRHVAFGYGAHLCLGQYLAKLEMRILFEELLPRLKSIALDGEVRMTQAYFVNGPKKLPIRFEVN